MNMATVLVVDDHELIRHGLVGAFRRAESFEVVGEAGTVAGALQRAHETSPDVLVTDVLLPDGSGLEIVRALRRERKDVGLVVLTMYAGDEQIFAAMDAGASAFVGKDAPSSSVVAAARQAAVAPLSFTCAGLAEAMVRRMTSGAPKLSDRERQVLELLADGLGVTAIASKLFVSESTAKSHIAKIYDKLGAANRAQALVSAMRLGLLTTVSAPVQPAR
jgi:DNA-binding NarL/FixJ family response regulator